MPKKAKKPAPRSQKYMTKLLFTIYKERGIDLQRYSVEHLLYAPEIRLLAEVYQVGSIDIASDIKRMAINGN